MIYSSPIEFRHRTGERGACWTWNTPFRRRFLAILRYQYRTARRSGVDAATARKLVAMSLLAGAVAE